jgi:hypothetical protein
MGVDWIDLAHDADKRRGQCEENNELPVSIKCRVFLGYLRHS